MARSASSRPGRSLGVLVGLIAVIFGVVAGGVTWSSAQWTPKLALDLEGGTEIVLTAVPQPGTTGTITQQTLDEAVKIIRNRINANGVSESEITTQGQKNIVVSLPGKTDQATKDAVTQAAALEFRAVLVDQAAAPAATPSPSPTSSGSVSPSPTTSSGAAATLKASSSPSAATSTASPTATTSSNGMAVPQALLAATPTPTSTAAGAAVATASPAAAAKATPSPSATAAKAPTSASDMNWITQDVATKFQALDCSKASSRKGGVESDPTKPLVTCSTDGADSFILGPAELKGTDISNASASLQTNNQGAVVGTSWQVNLQFSGDGAKRFATVTQRLANLTGSQNQFAIVLDGLVVSAPRTNEAITGGSAQITGSFTQDQAQTLANQLKFGALPISFQELTSQDISATLGSEQLQRGLLAGVIGLLLVVLYSLAQYRALGLVTVCSLVIAGVITYGLVVLLGWRQGYRLSLPGVAGLIVSIGITADSFIVYFERVRDEVRDGRGLAAAVEAAWLRARRTILISDAVSFLAAVVLFILAIGGVRGFAFTLGLTTLVDVLVVFLFTHPTVVLLSRTRFFGGGHRLSGFDAAHLGREVAYAGRGTTRGARAARPAAARAAAKASADAGSTGLEESGDSVPRAGTTIAERRAAAERARQEALRTEPGGGGTDGTSGTASSDTVTLEPEAAADARTGRRDA